MCERGGHGRRPRSGVSVGCTGSRVCCCRHLPRLVWASGSAGGFDDPRVAGGNAERVPMGPTSRGLLEFGHLPALSHSPCWGVDLDCSAPATPAVAWVVALCGGGVRGSRPRSAGPAVWVPALRAASGGPAPPRSLGVAPGVWVQDRKPRSALLSVPCCPETGIGACGFCLGPPSASWCSSF